MENNLINTLKDRERVTSTYAESYFDDDYFDISSAGPSDILKPKTNNDVDVKTATEWVSPSDLLIGIIDLKPPFTSKITRGQAHEGILAIGEEILAIERAKFIERLTTSIQENDAAWSHILEYEKAAVLRKVNEFYRKILKEKTIILVKEMETFYEESLQELETNLKLQVQKLLSNAHAKIISTLNTDIKEKLLKEKIVLNKMLNKRYVSEIAKLKKYYELLLNNELLRHNLLIKKTVAERNDALKAFYRQFEAENICSTMYVMCTERKKCRIKQFLVENYHTLELKEKYEKLKEKQNIINILKERDIHISQINKEWEDKVKKILQLFLKFISFSLRLLPEQSSFLLNFEKMVVLQLNEIQKMPWKTKMYPILIEEEDIKNTFKFDQKLKETDECKDEPFVIIGDVAPTPPPEYGSRETIPDDVDLPTVRLERKYVYAKCHHYEDIKAKLEAERCRCNVGLEKLPSDSKASVSDEEVIVLKDAPSIKSESSFEHLLTDDIHRFDNCPFRSCQNWFKPLSFPHLQSYLNFDDEKYKRVVTILGDLPKKGQTPNYINPRDIVYTELPFATTKEPYHTVETQYSSQEDLLIPNIECTCKDANYLSNKYDENDMNGSTSSNIMEYINRHETSFQQLLEQNPNLLKMFTDETFDLNIK